MQTEVWNQDQILSQFTDCENLRDLISCLEKKYQKKNQLVCEVRVNGMLLEEDDETRFGETEIKEIRELSVSVGVLEDLIEDVHKAFKECIPSLQETALRASDYFRCSDLGKAQNTFSALLEGCQWLVDTLVHVKKAGESHTSSVFSISDWKVLEKNFSSSLRQILMAFQDRDYSLLSDLLEYELTSVLDSWLAGLSAKDSAKSEKVEEANVANEASSGEGETTEASRSYEPVERVQDSLGGR